MRKHAAEAMHAVLFSAGHAGPLVRDRPYSAEAVTETIAAGAGHAVRRNVTKLYRDAGGSTRREQTIESLGPSMPAVLVRMVVVSDAVAKVDFILDPARKTARKFPRLDVEDSSQTLQASGEQANLGTRVIEGLTCTGTRRTVAIPGPGEPIRIVTEIWYSPAIEALVRSTTSDPRFGQTTYTLRNVLTAEPPRSLFALPADYKIEFEGRPGVMMLKRGDRP